MNLLAFLLIGFFWGLSFPAIKIVVEHVTPISGAFVRVLLSTLILTFILGVIMKKPLMIERRDRLKVWTAGLFLQGIPFSFLYFGEQAISAGLAAILNGTVPLWTFLLSLLFLRRDEATSRMKIAGIGLGFLGILVIYIPRIQFGGNATELWGIIAVTIMAICYGIGTVWNRRLLLKSQHINVYASLYQQHLASSVFLAVLALMLEGPRSIASVFVSTNALAATCYLALFSTALAWLCYFRLLREWGPLRTTAATYIIPVVTLSADFMMFRNIPTMNEVLGVSAILGGTLLIQLGALLKKRALATT
ncbi:MAG: DMT family transporter [Deltaproteobacteria bacterium]|nr:DMT family transporter [Deltaproteobacteria bacterium]